MRQILDQRFTDDLNNVLALPGTPRSLAAYIFCTVVIPHLVRQASGADHAAAAEFNGILRRHAISTVQNINGTVAFKSAASVLHSKQVPGLSAWYSASSEFRDHVHSVLNKNGEHLAVDTSPLIYQSQSWYGPAIPHKIGVALVPSIDGTLKLITDLGDSEND